MEKFDSYKRKAYILQPHLLQLTMARWQSSKNTACIKCRNKRTHFLVIHFVW